MANVVSASRMELFQRTSEVPETSPASFNWFTGRNCGPRLASVSAKDTSLALTLMVPRGSSFELPRLAFTFCQPTNSACEVKLPRKIRPSTCESEIFCGSTENSPSADAFLVKKVLSCHEKLCKSNFPVEAKL